MEHIIIINIIFNIILVVVVISRSYWESWMKQKGKNSADISQNRDKEYESEKGRNLATKEDIEEITEKIEQVKAEISFKNQWQHDHIQKREERLLHILHLANKILMAKNRIVIMSRNAFNVESLFKMINELDSYAVDLTDSSKMLLIDYQQFSSIHPATKLADVASTYAAELGCLANNVAIALQGAAVFQDRALADKADFSSRDAFCSLFMSKQAEDFIKQPLDGENQTKQAIEDYIMWLEQLYGEGALVNYNITELKN